MKTYRQWSYYFENMYFLEDVFQIFVAGIFPNAKNTYNFQKC